jgi:hypothetical protein
VQGFLQALPSGPAQQGGQGFAQPLPSWPWRARAWRENAKPEPCQGMLGYSTTLYCSFSFSFSFSSLRSSRKKTRVLGNAAGPLAFVARGKDGDVDKRQSPPATSRLQEQRESRIAYRELRSASSFPLLPVALDLTERPSHGHNVISG